VQKLTRDEMVESLLSAGIRRGDIVHVQSDLLRIGPVDCKPHRESILEFFLAGFLEVLGEEGTLTVGTSFEDYARYGTPFVLEESPSRQGAFSDYVRTRKGAVRSIHPIVSVSGLGQRAKEICGGSHFEGFGYESAWGRLHRSNAKILAFGLGVDHEGGTTFFHYLERLYGVPYQYTKVYTTPVLADGKQIEGVFTMSVRYLDFGIVNDTLKFKRHLVASGVAVDVPIGRGRMMCASCEDIVQEGVRCLNRDRYFLLVEPPKFRAGEIPMDGTTGPMRVLYDKAHERKP
jgi:aminoglycoside 3-N-acetyltransferase